MVYTVSSRKRNSRPRTKRPRLRPRIITQLAAGTTGTDPIRLQRKYQWLRLDHLPITAMTATRHSTPAHKPPWGYASQ